MPNNLRRTVIITGGNRGIGWDITQRFSSANYDVFVGSRSGMEQNLVNVTHVPMDVRKAEDHAMLVNHALLRTGRVDVYINNAGYSEWRPIDQIDEEFLDDIINISSIAGKRGSSNNSAYVATKFGMNGMTQSLAKEFGPNGIRVNGLCPVLIPTPGLMTALESKYAPGGDNPIEWMQKFAREQTALHRLPTGKEVADACMMLVNTTAITGQNINVDCGVFPQ